MKKLLLTTAMIMSASMTFASDSYTLTMDELKAIENHIQSLNSEISELKLEISEKDKIIENLNNQLTTFEQPQSKKPSGIIGNIIGENGSTENEVEEQSDIEKPSWLKPEKNSKTIPTTSSKPKSKGDWIVRSETNPIDDSTTVTAILFASTGKGTYGDRVGLVARCQSNKTEVYTNWQSYMGNGGIYGSDKHNVTVRIGTDKSMRQYWSYSSDGKATFAPQSIKLLRQIVKSNSTNLVLQASPYSESPITAVFDTTGAEESLATLAKTCNWKF
jgi:hypothetical protein